MAIAASAVRIDIKGECGDNWSLLVQQHKGRLFLLPVCEAARSITKPMPSAVRSSIWKTYFDARKRTEAVYAEARDDDPGENSCVSHSAWPYCILSMRRVDRE